MGVAIVPLYEVAMRGSQCGDGQCVARIVSIGAGSRDGGTHCDIGDTDGDIVGGDRCKCEAVDTYAVAIIVGKVESNLGSAGYGGNDQRDRSPAADIVIVDTKDVPSGVGRIAVGNSEFVLVATPYGVDVNEAEDCALITRDVEYGREEDVRTRASAVSKGGGAAIGSVSTGGAGTDKPFAAGVLPAVESGRGIIECLVIGVGSGNCDGIASGGEGGRSAPVALVGGAADRHDINCVGGVGVETGEGCGGAGDSDKISGERVDGIADSVAGLGAVGGCPGDSGRVGGHVAYGHVVRFSTSCLRQDMQAVVVSHSV